MRIVLILALLLAGCATAGNRVDQNKLSQIHEGITTEAQVCSILGNPNMKTLSSDGKIIMLYTFVKVKNRPENFIPVVNLFSSGVDMKQDMLTVLIGTNGTVEKYTFNTSDSAIDSGLLTTQ